MSTIQKQQEAINTAIAERLANGDLAAIKALSETVAELTGGDLSVAMSQLQTVLKNTIAQSEMLLVKEAAKKQPEPQLAPNYESAP